MMKTSWLIVMAFGALLLAGCKQDQTVQEEVRPVRTMTVGVASGTNAVEFSGEVRARHEVALSFRVGGKMASRSVDVGALVKPGQALARIDPQDLALNAEAARAQAAAAATELMQLKLDLSRSQELLAKKFVSQAEVDRRLTAVTAAQSKLEQAQAQQRLAGNQSTYATLTADATGVVTGVDAEPGQVLAAGQPVVRIARDGEREVVFDVAENQRAALTVGQLAEISLWALPGKSFAGKIREVAPAADPLTRTYRVRVALDAVEEGVRLGMSATVKLTLQQTAASASLPVTSVFGEGGKQNVWLLDLATGKVKRAAISVTGMEGDMLHASGLKQGDVVITAGVHLLREGQSVRLVRNASKAGS